jgi:hypothetical protein
MAGTSLSGLIAGVPIPPMNFSTVSFPCRESWQDFED